KANDHPHKFLPTVVSFWRQQGRVLSPVIEQQLSLHAQRLAAYDDLVTELRHSDSLVRELRGSLIRSLYPSGLIRQQQDIDLAVRDETSLWRLGRTLTDTGWQGHALRVGQN